MPTPTTWGTDQDRILTGILAEHEAEEKSAEQDLARANQALKRTGLTADEQIAIANAKADAAERIERAKAERRQLENELAREKRREQQDAKKEAARAKTRQQSYSKAGNDVAFQSPSRLQNRYLLLGAGKPTWLDAGMVGAGGLSVLWTATRPAGQDVFWALFTSAIGALATVEAEGEFSRLGQGALGANVGYAALRLFGKIRNP